MKRIQNALINTNEANLSFNFEEAKKKSESKRNLREQFTVRVPTRIQEFETFSIFNDNIIRVYL